MAMLLDADTGIARGLLRGVPTEVSTTAARRLIPQPGLEVVISHGIPNPSDW